MTISGAGIDVVEIRRFRTLVKEDNRRFLRRHFTDHERRYCDSYSDPATHYAGTFAAKEAVQKTLTKHIAPHEIEIRRTKAGKPEVWLKSRKARDMLVSISHEKSIACAIALRV